MANCPVGVSLNEPIHNYGEEDIEEHYFLAQWVTNWKGKDESPKQKCAVCGMTMDSPQNFPKGFPHRFRICCWCRDALFVFNGLKKCSKKEYEQLIMQRYKNSRRKFEEIFTL